MTVAEPRFRQEGLHGGNADLAWGAILALAAAVGFAILPPGSLLRLAVALPVLLSVPGYLLIQAAIVPPPPGRRRMAQVLLSLAVSPAVVGLLALSTALVRGGFRPAAIVLVVTVGCLLLAAVARHRRSHWSVRNPGDREEMGRTA